MDQPVVFFGEGNTAAYQNENSGPINTFEIRITILGYLMVFNLEPDFMKFEQLKICICDQVTHRSFYAFLCNFKHILYLALFPTVIPV